MLFCTVNLCHQKLTSRQPVFNIICITRNTSADVEGYEK